LPPIIWVSTKAKMQNSNNDASADTERRSEPFGAIANPSEAQVASLLAVSETHELRGIEDYNGTVHLWCYDMMAAGMLGIRYDPATDYVEKLTGKTFYIRRLDDWLTRERRRAEPDSFTSKCRNATSGPAR
jgi:hypothetical protein